jgi:glycosyltransferase involved in cell wall biosynthesis
LHRSKSSELLQEYPVKILYITPFVPWPVRVRTYNLIPRLARRHELHVVCVSSEAPNEEQRRYLERYCKKAVHVPHSRLQAVVQCVAALPTGTPMRMAYCKSGSARHAVRKILGEINPDLIYVKRWRPLQYVPEETEIPVLCDPTDSMTLYNRRLMRGGAWWERVIGWEEHRKFLDYEPKLARRADVSVFCSRVDMECVKERAPEARCELVPNGVDCEKFYFKKEEEEKANTLVFTGNFKYRPNWLAVDYFVREIFPLIRAEIRETKFLAVGNGASKFLAKYSGNSEGFAAIDFVPDLRSYLASATVAVAPMTVGAGVSNKLLEGFATGTAVVSTPLACGDLPVRNGEHLLLGNDSREFARNVITLLKERELRTRLARQARRLVEEHYDWGIVMHKLEDLMRELVLARSGGRTGELVSA